MQFKSQNFPLIVLRATTVCLEGFSNFPCSLHLQFVAICICIRRMYLYSISVSGNFKLIEEEMLIFEELRQMTGQNFALISAPLFKCSEN